MGYKHKILVTFVFSMIISQVEKIKNPFHDSQTNAKAQLKEEKKIKRKKRKKKERKRKKRFALKVYFDFIMWISSK
jgi:hypothetical protein